jgi:FAD/FMN-containing dehydrogenase
MIHRRELLKRTAGLGVAAVWPGSIRSNWAEQPSPIQVNDVQSPLNPTQVHRVVKPKSLEDIQGALRDAQREQRAVSIAGGRHSMGGQQFGTDPILLDMTELNRVVRFDRAAGHIEVEAGIMWPALMDYLQRHQADPSNSWAIRQK